MGKLTFIYGTMGSAKTANALMQYFELKNHYSNAILMKPSIDNRDGDNIIKSRIGLEETAVVFSPSDDLNGIMKFKGIGNMELVLDRKLQEKRVFPAIDIAKSGTRREDLLLTGDEQEAVYNMRKALNGLKSEEAVENILNMFSRTRNNGELVQILKKQKIWIA